MKVLLISVNRLTAPYPVYPLGLDYVAGAISDYHNVKLVDMNELIYSESICSILTDYMPDIIGLSIRNIDNTDAQNTLSYIDEYKQLLEEIRKASSSPVILGGSGFTIFPKELMDILNADYGIIGEGERLILLLKALEDNRDISDIPGIITRETNAAIPDPWNNEFTRIFNPENRYIQLYLQKGGMLNLQTKRGCPFECIYCTYPHIEGKHLRLICPDDVANTAKMLQEAGAKYLFITDSAFNSSYSHSIDVARAFINAGISIPWGAFFAPTKPPHDFYRIMADAGLTHVEFGTESMCNDILKSYKKPFNLNELFTAHRSASDAGLHIAHYLLLGGPDESDRTINETLENADKLDKSVFFFFCGIRIYPHTELYDIAIKERQISDTDRLIEPIFYNSQNLTSDEIIKRVEKHADGRPNWVIGAGGEKTAKILERMYTRGRYGPLWEHLIP